MMVVERKKSVDLVLENAEREKVSIEGHVLTCSVKSIHTNSRSLDVSKSDAVSKDPVAMSWVLVPNHKE